jgi:alkylhydroperoxidase family enzyme
VRDPSVLEWPAREGSLVALATRMTEAPWAVDDGDLARLRQAGIGEEGVVQAVTIAAVFNHLTRVADATGVAPDYVSVLPRIQVDVGRDAVARPARRDWPAPSSTPRLSLSLRPKTLEALLAWRTYARAPSAALSAFDRAVLGTVTSHELCDGAGVSSWGDAHPTSPREQTLATYATKLTTLPWRVGAADLEPLRREGLDDRGLLDVMGVVGFQNMDSRVRLVLGG